MRVMEVTHRPPCRTGLLDCGQRLDGTRLAMDTISDYGLNVNQQSDMNGAENHHVYPVYFVSDLTGNFVAMDTDWRLHTQLHSLVLSHGKIPAPITRILPHDTVHMA